MSELTEQMNHFGKVLDEIVAEYERARRLYPVWPADVIQAVALMMEEAGEATQAANNYYWGHKEGTLLMLRKEVIETAAMCLRILLDTQCFKVKG